MENMGKHEKKKKIRKKMQKYEKTRKNTKKM